MIMIYELQRPGHELPSAHRCFYCFGLATVTIGTTVRVQAGQRHDVTVAVVTNVSGPRVVKRALIRIFSQAGDKDLVA